MTSAYDFHILNSSLLVAVGLFVIGAVGLMARRNLVVICFSAAIMLQGVCLAFCSFGSFHGDWTGRTSGWIVLAMTSLFAILMAGVGVAMLTRCRSLELSSLPESASSADSGVKANDSLPLRSVETSLQSAETGTPTFAGDTADHA